ncbi:hypothetical protein ABW636_02410 [Aquimarina sp. 2201CG1-2-11]|uniref:hypothetical protein n=1 Tax=Aquimarina discodermiae TaxID=3231043 RepID=UPI003461F960
MIKTLSTLLLFILFFVGFSATPNTELETKPTIENSIDDTTARNTCWYAQVIIALKSAPKAFFEGGASIGTSKADALACAMSSVRFLHRNDFIIHRIYYKRVPCGNTDPRYSID